MPYGPWQRQDPSDSEIKVPERITMWKKITTNGTYLLCDTFFVMRQPFNYATTFTLCDNFFIIHKFGSKIWFILPKIFSTPTPNKIFSHPTHPHSSHFTYKYQNFSYFYFKYMVHKPHTFQVLGKLVYGL